MICPTCGSTNRDGAAFCLNCGRLLLAACPRCRATAEQGANFCDTCGAPLSPLAWTGGWRLPAVARATPLARFPAVEAQSTASQLKTDRDNLALDRFIPRELLDKLAAAQGSAAERRVVTLLFCDIQGSTALAEQFDPEEWTEIVNGAFEQMVRPVYKYEGTVARLMGDGLLAFFGAPIAHEDDPRRAILAGLAIVEGIRAYRETLPPTARDLDVRVGINTGLVVVGAVGSDLRLEYSAIGDAINLAARMEQTAAPGTVRVAEDTYRLTADQFEFETLGGIEVKGKATLVPAYRVLRRTGGDSRKSYVSMRAALVNRRMEWEALERAFDALGEGRGGIFFLTGDAGLGKTRLIDEVAERLMPKLTQPGRIFDASAVSYETNQPYGLLIRLLRQPLGLTSGDPLERVRERIAQSISTGPPETMSDDRAVVETLFGVAPAGGGPDLSGEAFARRLEGCVERLWRSFTAGGPLVLALDDLQWLDVSSADCLARMFHLTESAPVLFLCALRRDRRAPAWGLKEAVARDMPHRMTETALHPLNDGESRSLLAGLLGAADLPDLPAGLILEKAEGNPLFLEEVLRHLIERGDLTQTGGEWIAAPTVAEITLPDSLLALLTARIDRLDEATRRTLQVASVIGRHFLRSTLAALVDDPDTLDSRLLELQRMELIREVSRVPEPGYLFNHTLTQEAVYNTILLKQRRAMHRRVAEVIESLRAANLSAVAPVLANHFIEGEAPERALPYLLLAAESALRLHATAEAITQYERALPIARALPGGAERLAEIYTNRGRALELQSRFAEAKQSYEELEQLALEMNNQTLELESLIAQGKLYANVTPYYDAAHGRALMERAMGLAKATGNRVAEVRILWNLVNIDRFDLNSLENALRNGERGVALARELELDEELAYLLNDVGDIYGMVGQFENESVFMDEAREKWRSLGNEAMLADSLSSSAVWESIHGRLQLSLEFATEAYKITTRLGNIWGEAYSQSVHGQVLGLMGEYDPSITDLRQGIEKALTAGFVGGQVISYAFLSRIYWEGGDYATAIELARAGMEVGRKNLPQFVGMCIGPLALGLIAEGKVEAAAETLADPLAYHEQQQVFVKNELSLANIHLGIAQGRLEDAAKYAEETIDYMNLIQSLTWLPYIRHAGAGALLGLGRLDEAAESLALAVTEARSIGMRGVIWRFLGLWAAVEEQRGDHDAAAALWAESAAGIDAVVLKWPAELRASFLAQPDAARVKAVQENRLLNRLTSAEE